MPRDTSTLEIRGKLAYVGSVGFARGSVKWEEDHIKIVLKPKDSRGLTEVVVLLFLLVLRV